MSHRRRWVHLYMPDGFAGSEQSTDFCKVLNEVAHHSNRRYFTLKSIAVNNLYGVDTMEEVVEKCKLRLLPKLIVQVELAGQVHG